MNHLASMFWLALLTACNASVEGGGVEVSDERTGSEEPADEEAPDDAADAGDGADKNKNEGKGQGPVNPSPGPSSGPPPGPSPSPSPGPDPGPNPPLPAPAPEVDAVSPLLEQDAGGATLTVTGSHFMTGATVTVGGAACPVTSMSATSITCTLPAGTAGTARDVVVTNPDLQAATLAASFTYVTGPAPTIATVAPDHGLLTGGTTLVLTGTGFVAGIEVKVGSVVCAPGAMTATQLSCTTGAQVSADLYDVTVTLPDTRSDTSDDAFYQAPLATVSSVTPNGGIIDGGTTVTIAGNYFLAGTTVEVGGLTCDSMNVASRTSMTCVTRAHAAGQVDVELTDPDAAVITSSNAFTYALPPYVQYVVPKDHANTAGGTNLTVMGWRFNAGAKVQVGGTDCTSTTFVSPKKLTCVAPAKAAGNYDVTVVNGDQQLWTLPESVTYGGALAWTEVERVAGAANPRGYVDATGSEARFFDANELVSDGTGNLYFLDPRHVVGRKLDTATGTLSTWIGDLGTAGAADGQGTSASFTMYFRGLTYDTVNGYFYLGHDTRIRRVDSVGNVLTLTSGLTHAPSHLATDGTYIYYTRVNGLKSIHRVTIGTWTDVLWAGDDTLDGTTDANGSSARFMNPSAMITHGGDLYVIDSTRLRRIQSNGDVSTFINFSTFIPDSITSDGTYFYVSNPFTGVIYSLKISDQTLTPLTTSAGMPVDGASGATARVKNAAALVHHAGKIYFAEYNYEYRAALSMRRLDLATGGVTTLAGDSQSINQIDGIGDSARMVAHATRPLAFGDEIYFGTGEGHSLRKLNLLTREVTTVAGTNFVSGSATGPFASATFATPGAVTTDGRSMFVTGEGNIRVVDLQNGTVGPATTTGYSPYSQSAVSDGTYVYVSDNLGYRILRYEIATGAVTTLAGTQNDSNYVNAIGTAAKFVFPTGLLHVDGRLYVCDGYPYLRVIDTTTAEVTTLAGDAGAGFADGNAATARFYFGPSTNCSLTSDGQFIYVSDTGNMAIRKIEIATGDVSTVMGRTTVCSQNGHIPYSDCEIDGPIGTAGYGPGALYTPIGVTYTHSRLYLNGYTNFRVIQ